MPALSSAISPAGISFDRQWNLLISDFSFSVVRKINRITGIITTIAGVPGHGGYSGDGGPAIRAELEQPYGTAVDNAGNIYIADRSDNVIRKVDVSTGVITTVAGSGYGAGTSYGGYSCDAGPARLAQLWWPSSVAIDSRGNLYIADEINNVIRKVDSVTGIISTFIGGQWNAIGDGGPADSANISMAASISIDNLGNFYISDICNERIRKVDALTNIITTVAGNGYHDNSCNGGFSGDGGVADSAEINRPTNVAIAKNGDLYIADNWNYRVRKVSYNNTTGINSGNNSTSINIFPNPVVNACTLAGLNSGLKVEVYDLLGQKIDTYIANDNKMAINFTGYYGGIYTISVRTREDILVKNIKIIKTY